MADSDFTPYLIPTGDTIYLDHAATTPVDPAILPIMFPWYSERFGNPSSIYQLGQESHHAIDTARRSVARVLGCSPDEIVFTSGATESNNTALAGVAWQARLSGRYENPHLIVSAIEHHAVLHEADYLRRQGFEVSIVPVSADGLVDPDDVRRAIQPNTVLVSVMYVNNEIGTIQPIAEIGAIARSAGIVFHTDAVQAAGWLPLDVGSLNVDLLSLSAHKFYGPKGAGVLYVRKGTPIEWQQHGGGQESGRRGGTEQTPSIVGMAAALERAESLRPHYAAYCEALRDSLWSEIDERIPEVELNGSSAIGKRIPGNLNFAIPGVQGETLLLNLDLEGIAASAGSACTTGNSEPSHVLKAIGLAPDRARSSLRMTVGRCNSPEQIREAAEALATAVERVRALSPSIH